MTPWQEYLTIKRLLGAGMTESAIAEQLGRYVANRKTGRLTPARSWVQPRAAVTRLPKCVEREFRKVLEARATRMSVTDILINKFTVTVGKRTEVVNGIVGAVRRYGANSPQFRQVWAIITDGPVATPKPSTPEVRIVADLRAYLGHAAFEALVKKARN